MTPDQADEPLPLPGLDEPARPPSALERAVRRTVLALQEKELLTEADAADLQMMIELAEIITMKKTTKRASTISNDLRLLWEIKNSFTETDDEVNDQLREAMEAWEAALGDEVTAGGGRDGPE